MGTGWRSCTSSGVDARGYSFHVGTPLVNACLLQSFLDLLQLAPKMFQTFSTIYVWEFVVVQMQQQFTSREVIVLTGITPRQLQWWDERGVVVPSRQGHRRLYSMEELAEVAVICELRRRGFSLQRVRKVIN